MFNMLYIRTRRVWYGASADALPCKSKGYSGLRETCNLQVVMRVTHAQMGQPRVTLETRKARLRVIKLNWFSASIPTVTAEMQPLEASCHPTFFNIAGSGVARLGHTGARALATRGRAPPVQIRNRIIGADSIAVDRKSGAKRS